MYYICKDAMFVKLSASDARTDYTPNESEVVCRYTVQCVHQFMCQLLLGCCFIKKIYMLCWELNTCNDELYV